MITKRICLAASFEWRGLKERNAHVDTIQSNPAGLPSGSFGTSLLHEGRHHALPCPADLPKAKQPDKGLGIDPVD
jgi:hypothetical protein